MIKEIADFVNYIDPQFKALSVKPREGLHILLSIKSEEQNLFINGESSIKWAFTKTKEQTPDDLALLKKLASLSQLAWCVNTNKCFDLPVKAIHSCSPYCLALKRENLEHGEKYNSNQTGEKSQIYDRINAYFSKTEDLLENEAEKQRVEIFKQALNSKGNLHRWLNQIPAYKELKDSDYVIFYLDEPIEKYEHANSVYLSDKLFNTNIFNETIEEIVFGTSDFFNGYPTKKPFLTHQSASFDIANRISSGEARDLYDFQNVIGILPRPLPLFIYKDELKTDAIALFKKGAENGERLSYKSIMESLYENHAADLGNYYLLYYHLDEIKDFDFVSKFEYKLFDRYNNRSFWTILNLFDLMDKKDASDKSQPKKYSKIYDVFDLERLVFGNIWPDKFRRFEFYFNKLEGKDFEKLEFTFIAVMKYRKAVYDYIYKSKRKTINSTVIKDIMLSALKDDLRHGRDYGIKEKLNIWFSINHHFDAKNSNFNNYYMPDKLDQLINKTMEIADSKERIPIEDEFEFAFIAGQLIDFLVDKSQSADNSHNLLESFLQKTDLGLFKKEISRYFARYKHAIERDDNGRFKHLMREVMGFDKKVNNMQDLITFVLAGYFSNSFYYTKKLTKEQ